MSPKRDVVDQIRWLEDRWIKVYLEGDAEGFAGLLTEDFIYTSERGVFDTQTYVSTLAAAVIEMRGLSNSDHEVRVHGSTAILTGASTLEASYQGQDISGVDRFTRVWVDEGVWRAAALHANNVEPAAQSRIDSELETVVSELGDPRR